MTSELFDDKNEKIDLTKLSESLDWAEGDIYKSDNLAKINQNKNNDYLAYTDDKSDSYVVEQKKDEFFSKK